MRKTALTALKIVVSVGILGYIFTRVVDLPKLWANLRTANLLYFACAVGIYFLVQGLSAYRWYVLLKPQGIDISYGKILSLYFLGMYFNFFLPSSIGGDVFRVYYLHKETKRLSASTASVFLDRDIGMGGLVLLAVVVASISGVSANGIRLAPLFGLVAVGFVAANLALFYRPTYNLLHRLLSLFRMKRVDEKIERMFDSVNCYRGRWGLLLGTLLMSIGVQVGCALVNLVCARAIGLQRQNDWLDFLVFIPTIGLIGMIPLSVGGAGWREGAYILLFQSVGASADQAAALSVLWLGAVVATSLPGGVIYLLRGGKKADISGPPPKPGGDKDEAILGETPNREQLSAVPGP
jgi:glycosyltransferase 2 family protein